MKPRAARPSLSTFEVTLTIRGEKAFPSVEAATEHYYSTHGKPEDEPTA